MTDGAGEFDLIKRLMAPLAGTPGAFGLKNDGCVVAPSQGHELVLSTDTLIEGVHYLPNTSPNLIAAKIMGVNLSDLAAMGARPVGYLLNCSLKSDQGEVWLAGFYEELGRLQEEFGLSLMGGDTTKTIGPAVFSLTILGEVPAQKALRRDGGRPGDLVYVSATIGDGALGLKAACHEISDDSGYLKNRYERPRPRLALGQGLRDLATSCLDISDGLVQDLGHLCAQSGVGAHIQTNQIPLSPAAQKALAQDSGLIKTILGGGDDYELLFSLPPEKVPALNALAGKIDCAVTQIGMFTETPSINFLDETAKIIELDVTGYRHF